MRISDWSSDVCSSDLYRDPVVTPGTLFLAISQSGETADTLAALREAKKLGYVGTCAICNVAESSVVREADLALMTRAGPEIGRPEERRVGKECVSRVDLGGRRIIKKKKTKQI